MTDQDRRYYLRHQVGVRWWDFPWHAYTGADYPRGRFLGVAATRRGALRLIAKDRKSLARKPEVETEMIECTP